ARRDERDLAPLARLVRYFGGIPAGAPARVHLAQRYLEQQRLAEAELVLLRANPEYRDWDSSTWAQEQLVASQLCGRSKQATPGQEAYRDACYAPWSLADWPDGPVAVARQRVRSRGDSQNQLNAGGPLRATLTPAATGNSWRGPQGLVLIDGGSQLLATDP